MMISLEVQNKYIAKHLNKLSIIFLAMPTWCFNHIHKVPVTSPVEAK